MATETVVAFFDDAGSAVTGLTPTISAVNLAGSSLFSGQMSEIGAGRYKYTISDYDKTVQYLISIDGGGSLSDGVRFQYASNELDSYDNKLDWRGSFTFIMDEKKLAQEIWDTDASAPKQGSYGSFVVKGVDMSAVASHFEALKKQIESIELPEFPEGLSLGEIEDIIKRHTPKDTNILEAIRDAVVYMKDVNANVSRLHKEIEPLEIATVKTAKIAKAVKELDNKLEDMDSKLVKLDTKSIEEKVDKIKSLDEALEYVSGYEVILKDLWQLPKLLEQYNNIASRLTSVEKADEKIASIHMAVRDILNLVRKHR